MTLQDDKVKEIFIPGFSDRETDIQYPKTPNSGSSNEATRPADPGIGKKAANLAMAFLKLAGGIFSIPATIAYRTSAALSKALNIRPESASAVSGIILLGAAFGLIFLHAPKVVTLLTLLQSGVFVEYARRIVEKRRDADSSQATTAKKEMRENDALNGSKAEPTVPAPASNGNATLEATIEAAINQAQTIHFIVRNQGVYQDAQDTVKDLKLNTGWTVEEARALGTTAYAINSRTWNELIPAVQNIIDVMNALKGKSVQIDVEKWARLQEAGQAAVQDLEDMSSVSAQISDALSNNKASAQDIEEWKTLSACFHEDSANLIAAFQKLNLWTPKTPNSGSSNKGKIIAGLAIGTLALAFMPHLAPAAALTAAHAAPMAAAHSATHHVLLGIAEGIGGLVLGVLDAILKSGSSMAAMPLALTFGSIGLITGGLVGFFGLPLLAGAGVGAAVGAVFSLILLRLENLHFGSAKEMIQAVLGTVAALCVIGGLIGAIAGVVVVGLL